MQRIFAGKPGHSGLATAGSEDVALKESLGQRMLQRIKRYYVFTSSVCYMCTASLDMSC